MARHMVDLWRRCGRRARLLVCLEGWILIATVECCTSTKGGAGEGRTQKMVGVAFALGQRGRVVFISIFLWIRVRLVKSISQELF